MNDKLIQLFSIFSSFSVEERRMFLPWAKDMELALRYNDLELAIHIVENISIPWMVELKEQVLEVLNA